MNASRLSLALLLALTLTITGCWKKKADDQASLTGTGFETLESSQELTQLPQTAGAAQQAAIEVLPIESSPVTENASFAAAPVVTPTVSTESLSYNQKIQTALKNAGLYEGAVDGKIGPMTLRAIQTFQKNNGLKVDGKVGSKTWALLEPYLNSSRDSR